MTGDKKDYIRYRIERAKETLDVAGLVLDNGHLYDAVNRLYYACFYAVSALLIAEEMHSAKHKGIRSLFDQHWINTKRLPVEMGRFYRLLFDARHTADYEDMAKFN